jgi:hypothetical protein
VTGDAGGTTGGDRRLDIPALSSRSSRLWSVATLVALVVVAAYVSATQPQNRWAVLVVLALAAVLTAFLLVRRTWVDTSTGEVVHRTLLGTRTVPLGEADTIELTSNRGGGLLLRVRRRGSRRSTYLPVLALTDHVSRSQPAATLRALAEQVWTWAPERQQVLAQLRAQAEHLEGGGSAEDSPLAPLVTTTVTDAARRGGAAGGTSLLG